MTGSDFYLGSQNVIFQLIFQATQVNAWTGLLMNNGEKISDLCSQLETVKVEQDELDQELDRVNAQQAELEGLFI